MGNGDGGAGNSMEVARDKAAGHRRVSASLPGQRQKDVPMAYRLSAGV